MIYNISLAIAGWMQKEGVILQEDSKLYSYAVYSTILGLIPLFLAITLGLLLQMLHEALLLIIPFMLIRKFSGGFHLNSERQCIFASCFLLLLAFCFVKYVIYTESLLLLTLSVFSAATILYLYSPIDNTSRKLGLREFRVFKKIARILTVLFLNIYLILLYMTQVRSAAPIGTGLILASLLQLPCIYLKNREKQYNF